MTKNSFLLLTGKNNWKGLRIPIQKQVVATVFISVHAHTTDARRRLWAFGRNFPALIPGDTRNQSYMTSILLYSYSVISRIDMRLSLSSCSPLWRTTMKTGTVRTLNSPIENKKKRKKNSPCASFFWYTVLYLQPPYWLHNIWSVERKEHLRVIGSREGCPSWTSCLFGSLPD